MRIILITQYDSIETWIEKVEIKDRLLASSTWHEFNHNLNKWVLIEKVLINGNKKKIKL